MVEHKRPIVLTCGEPAGIGPDLAVKLAQNRQSDQQIVVTASALVLKERAAALNLPLRLRTWDPDDLSPAEPGELLVHSIDTLSPVIAGTLNPDNATHVLQLLDFAIDGCQQGRFSAMVTGPLHKGVINEAGIPFTGHTEYLAEKTGGWPVMMLAGDSLRVALATTHLPIASVAREITRERLEKVLSILHHDLLHQFRLPDPHILVCGLNPHAGEGGHLGREEIDIIEPALESLRDKGMKITGPLPADTLFTPRHLKNADAVLAMYHDQGLPVLKFAEFGRAVNITLGLTIVRTSVDHGTALDLAATGNIDSGSLFAAIKMATKLG